MLEVQMFVWCQKSILKHPYSETPRVLPLPWGQRLPKGDVWQKSMNTRRKESGVGGLLDLQKGQVAPMCYLEFQWGNKDHTNILNIFCCWIFSVQFLVAECCQAILDVISSKTEKQILSLHIDVGDLAVLMPQQAHSIRVWLRDKMANWWCPQIKPIPTEKHPFGPWPLFLFKSCKFLNFSTQHKLRLVGKLCMLSFSK